MVTSFFCMWTSLLQSPQKGKCNSNSPVPPPLPIPKTRPGNTWTHPSVTNFLRLNPPQYESSHHKQDSLITTSKISHFLLQLQFMKSYNLHLTSAYYYKFYTHPHATIFLTARRRSKESFHPCGHARKSWTHPAPSFPWLTSETKRWNFGRTLRYPPLNETRNLPSSHLITLPPSPP